MLIFSSFHHETAPLLSTALQSEIQENSSEWQCWPGVGPLETTAQLPRIPAFMPEPESSPPGLSRQLCSSPSWHTQPTFVPVFTPAYMYTHTLALLHCPPRSGEAVKSRLGDQTSLRGSLGQSGRLATMCKGCWEGNDVASLEAPPPAPCLWGPAPRPSPLAERRGPGPPASICWASENLSRCDGFFNWIVTNI